MKKSVNKPYIHVKIAGGATAQCLGLMNAIFASNKLNMPFKISYFPYSTGTYWPFAIKFLLEENEVLNLNFKTKGLSDTAELETGKIIKNHPLFRKGISYEKLLSLLRNLNLEKKLQFMRRELAVNSSPQRLTKLNKYFKSISGGFAQINDPEVNKAIDKRFKKAGIASPFSQVTATSNLIIIHYRLGDKKATPAQMHHTNDFNTDLIIDPITYFDLINQIEDLDYDNIFVVSDEPKLAQKLLAQVNIKAKIKSQSGNIWEDVLFMSQANIFIGSKSQVSQLVNICVENRGGRSYMLNFFKEQHDSNFPNTKYLDAKFLEPSNEIYSLNFNLESKHTAYGK
jgi:hypothetical protein